MGAPVVHWEINARDAGRVQEFYSKLFDWKVNANNPMHYGLVNTGSRQGQTVELVRTTLALQRQA